MSRFETRQFYAATPIWFWPVLAWSLYWMLRYLDREAKTQRFLAC
jgi:hypothetical protein